MTMKNKQPKPGSFLRIPLADGTFGYGRQLEGTHTAFYNYRTSEPSEDLDAIERQPILFRQAVRLIGLKRWAVIGTRPLKGEVTEPFFMFHQEIGDFRKCTIIDNLGNEKSATPEECIGLEQEAVWEAHGIENRLLDTFEGRSNETELRSRVRLK